MMTRRSGGPRRVTVRDVARAARVSIQTVSNVVHRKPNAAGPETIERVNRAIERLRYKPLASGRGLRVAENRAVGMLVVDEVPAFLSDPFITELVAGLSNYLSSHDYSLELQGVTRRALAHSNLLTRVRTDALCAIMCGSDSERREFIRLLADCGQPVVIFQEHLDIGANDIVAVRQDDFGGAKAIAAHLRQGQLARCVFLAPELEWPAIGERLRGFREGVVSMKPSPKVDLLTCREEDFGAVQDALARYFNERGTPDVVVASNDRMAIAALRLCSRLGLKVPEQVRITGFNGFESASYTTPVLTTVLSPAYAMGQHAGACVLRRLNEGTFPPNLGVFPVSFRVGDSS